MNEQEQAQSTTLAAQEQSVHRIKGLQKKLAQIGKIRFGKKGAKNAPEKLSTIRLTSPDKSVLDAAAKAYGGTVQPWNPTEFRKEWELITAVKEIPFIISPLPITQYMEDWGGGECKRRCDGVTEMKSGKPCMCEATGNVVCKPTTRFSVILKDLPGVGIWLFESHGWNAATELTFTADLLMQWTKNHRRPVRARLLLESRQSKKDGQTRNYVVPKIAVDETPEELLMLGQSQPEVPALESAVDTQERIALPPNLRQRYWAMHGEMGYPKHEHPEVKKVNYRIWTAALGRVVTSATDFEDKDWLHLCQLIETIRDEETGEPQEWAEWRIGQHVLQLEGVQ
jgi:hypothetical protein